MKATFPNTDYNSNKPATSGALSSSDMRNALSALFQGDLAPLRPRAQSTPDLTLTVSGSLIEDYFCAIMRSEQTVEMASSIVSVASSPVSNPRIDLLVLNGSNELEWVQGSEAASPSPNWSGMATDDIPVCLVYMKTGMTKVVNYEDKDTFSSDAYIYRDCRPFLLRATDVDLSTKVDDFTIKYSNSKLKLADRIELSINTLAFWRSVDQGASIYNLPDGFIDQYEDETGIDTGNSTNESYDSSNDYYKPTGLDVPFLHYKCDDNAANTTVTNDGSGSGNATASANTSSLSTTGKLNNAFDLNGSSHYLNHDSLASTIRSDTQGSIALWVNLDSLSAGHLFCLGDSASNTAFNINVFGSGKLSIQTFQNGSQTNNVETVSAELSGGDEHIEIIQDGTGLVVKINGTSVSLTTIAGSNTFWFSAISTANQLTIGARRRNGTVDDLVNGRIDDVRIYRSALTTDQQNALYNSGNGVAASAIADDLTLISNAKTADAAPDQIRAVCFVDNVSEFTINTDFKLYVSRDGGTTWTQITLTNEGSLDSNSTILSGIADVSGQPAGTSIKYKIETTNSANPYIRGVALNWD